MSSIQQYIELFEAQRPVIEQGAPASLNIARQEALAALKQKGLPTAKTETYKYTDVEAAFAPDYGVNLRRIRPNVDPHTAYRCAIPNLSTRLCHLVNDIPMLGESGRMTYPDGVTVSSFRAVTETERELLQEHYGAAVEDTPERGGTDAISQLNTLLAQDGLLIYVPDGVKSEIPLQLVEVAATTQAELMSNRRLLIVIGRDSALNLLCCDHAQAGANGLTTQVAEIRLDEKACLDLYRVEETHAQNRRFNNLYVRQAASSRFNLCDITLQCGLTRNTLRINLTGEGAVCNLAGAVMADGSQSVDNNILVRHAVGSCSSDMLYKYVLDGQSRGAFAGKVLVEKDAQKSLSEQTNANLCASPQARAFSQPMLEIYADDVKCNHGSTVGKLDEAALFYMRQRGIEEREARILLQHAFVNDVISRISIDHVRERISHLVERRFRGELEACGGCHLCK